jgi:hypothetical protein
LVAVKIKILPDKEVKKYIVCFASKAIGSVFYVSNNHDLGSHRVN